MNQEVFSILVDLKAIITNNHILYTSGKHGSEYVNKDALYPHTEAVSKVCSFIAKRFAKAGVDVVLAPALGGIVLTQWIAHHLTLLTGRQVLAVYAEKNETGDFQLKRGYGDLVHNKKILIVEDVLNTGGSVKKVVELVKKQQGNIVAVAALCNRGGVTPNDLGNVAEIFSLIELDFKAWEPTDCPLCAKKIPISKEYGKGAKA